MSVNQSSFGEGVKDRRGVLGLTQDELARRVGCALITIRKIESDDLRVSVQIAERLAVCLNLPLEERADFVRLARADLLTPAEGSFTPMPAPEEIGSEDLSGRAIRGYALGELIGRGGMGAVYRAVQPLVEREVAIKIILPQYANHPDFIRRFEAEAQLVARLEHPHIVPLYDYWREPGVAYLVMRLIRGGSLQAYLQNLPQERQERALNPAFVLRICTQIGAALSAAHRAGVVHRDLKPANVLLDEDHNAYLADFGIAKNLSSPASDSQSGAIVGSPNYISPEQVRSDSITPQTDIYSLGVMLYELLSGSLPFHGATPVEIMIRHLNDPLPLLAANRAGLPPGLDVVIGRATAKVPQQRYANVDEMIDDLREALQEGGQVIPTLPVQPGPDDSGAIQISDADNPYQGLRAFAEGDAQNFFGRESLVRQLLARLSESGDLTRFLAVVGPSGSGKSSAVCAGLIPALRRGALPGSQNWFIVEMLPGPHPLEELEAALLRVAINPPDSLLEQLSTDSRGLLRAARRCLPGDLRVELVLVIDQFEEIFTLVQDEAVRAHLLDLLVTAVMDERSRVRVIVTLRADFIDRPLGYADFGELLRQRMELVLPLNPDELEQAITGPARRAGLQLEAGLLAAILRDLGDQPGTLPLLQYALTQLFDQREGRSLTRAAYQKLGGVLGALSLNAEDIYASLDEPGRAAARQLFLRLVTLGEGVEDTRRRVLRTELENLVPGSDPGNPVRAVLEAFGRSRLLSFDRDPLTRGATVEVAHEAILRRWARLGEWLAESRGDVRLQRLLGLAAAEWLATGQEVSFLLTGARLAQYEGWIQTSSLTLTPDEKAFLDASIAGRERLAAEEQLRQQRELQTVQKLAQTERQSIQRLRARSRVISVVGVAALFLAALAGFLAYESNQNASLAEQQRNVAVMAQATAQSDAQSRATAEAIAVQERVAAQADAQSRATAEAVAVKEGETAQNSFLASERARLAALALNSFYANESAEVTTLLALRSLLHFGYSPEADGTLWKALGRGFVRRTIGPINSSIYDVAFLPGGKNIVIAPFGGKLTIYNLETGTMVEEFDSSGDGLFRAALSADGKQIVTGGDANVVILWDVATKQQLRQFKGHSASITSVAISPSGGSPASASMDGTVRVWDLQKGVERFRLEGDGSAVYALAYSADGKYLLSGGEDKQAWLWDAQSGVRLTQYTGHTDRVSSVAFSPDGKTMATGSADRTVRIWTISGGESATATHILHTNADVESVAFSPDGRFLLSTGGDGLSHLWDSRSGAELKQFTGHASAVWCGIFSPDSQMVLTGSEDLTAKLWSLNLDLGPQLVAGNLPDYIKSFEITPDGKSILVGVMTPPVLLLDLNSAIERFKLVNREKLAEDESIMGIDLSPDGKWAVTGGRDEVARLWDLQTGQEVRMFVGHKGWVFDAKFTRDGLSVVTSGSDGTIRLWDVQTGQQMRLFAKTGSKAWRIVVSADGRYLAAGLINGSVWVLDVASGAQVEVLGGDNGSIHDVAFSPDGKYLVSASDTNVIEWDLASGKELRHLSGHTDTVDTVSFSHDGKWIASGSYDKTTRIWDAATGQAVRILVGELSWVQPVRFSADDRFLYTASLDPAMTVSPSDIRAWRLDLQEEVRLVCAALPRDFTPEERVRYGISGNEPTCPVGGTQP